MAKPEYIQLNVQISCSELFALEDYVRFCALPIDKIGEIRKRSTIGQYTKKWMDRDLNLQSS